MKTVRKQTFSLLLALVVCLSLFPAQVDAEQDFIEEEGTVQDTVVDTVPAEDPASDETGDMPESIPDEETVLEEQDEDLILEEPAETDGNRFDEALVIEEEETAVYDRSCITGFSEPEFTQVTRLRKPALCAALALLPEEIGVYVGGTPSSEAGKAPEGAELRTIPVTWECIQDYDEWLYDYEFIPVAEGYQLAEGVKAPVITLTVEDLSIPEGGHVDSGTQSEIPIVGAAAGMRRGIPGSYNGYELGNLPPVRDQNPYGTCWAFAAIGAMEADLIADGSVSPDSIDLSELHLAWFTKHTYTDPKGLNIGDRISDSYSAGYLASGGNGHEASLTMANMVGPVDEASAPYETAAYYAPSGAAAKSMTTVQLVRAYKMNPGDRDAIKEAILEHGAVSASIMAKNNEACYSAKENSFYYPGQGTDHDILLVGWDDSFSRSRFPQGSRPSGDGAWLVRNSWGDDGYGFSGYFWLSYYDGGLLSSLYCMAYDAEWVENDNVYACDSLTALTTWWYSVNTGDQVIQHLTVDGGESVEAVGMQLGAGNDVTVTVTDGAHTATGTCSTTYEGFYRIPLNAPFTLANKKELTITVKYNAPGQVFFEGDWLGDYLTGEHLYESACGSGGFVIDYASPYWLDETVNNDACIKIYTDNRSVQPELTKYETTLNMADFTGIFVYIALPEGADASEYTVEASGASYRQSYAKAPVAVSTLPKGSGARANMYRFEAMRAGSPEMTDEVTVTLKWGNQLVRSESFSVYSVVQGMLASGSMTADQVSLLKGLLQYGYYGHGIFKNPLSFNPVIDGAPAPVAIPSTYAAKGDPTDFGAYVTNFTEKLNLDSVIAMNLYLTLANGRKMSDFTFTVLDKDGKVYGNCSVSDAGSSQVLVRIGGIKSPQMARNFKLVVTLKSDPTKTATWTRSVWTCAYEGSARTSGTGLSFLQALYQYGLYAQKQFPKVA